MRVIIEPAPIEIGLNEEAYDALVADLEAEGHEAEIRHPVEQRSGIPQEAINVAIWLGERVTDGTLDVLIGIFVERMRQSRRRRTKPSPRLAVAVFYGPDGKPLKRIEIPERSED